MYTQAMDTPDGHDSGGAKKAVRSADELALEQRFDAPH